MDPIQRALAELRAIPTTKPPQPRTVRQLAPCGTHAAYQRHRRHGEPVCDDCREAARLRSAKQRADEAR
ncbi:hypothetical protein AB0A76_09135 [Streptomyces exfoliatus]|uniref:Uncharacterized protein n=1 Tax=Streptomyces exfoliatus TaxID=1905 RepID=A0ABV3CT29_STREX